MNTIAVYLKLFYSFDKILIMKKIIFFAVANVFLQILNAQNLAMPDGGGAYTNNLVSVECLNYSQRELMRQQINANKLLLQAQGKLQAESQLFNPNIHPQFIWPVTKSTSAPYNNCWSISNHVDHNVNYPNAIQDWNCGTRSYDTNNGYNHKGIDIFTWPFSWFQMDNDEAFAVAAAQGVIIYKLDGNYDRNCSFNSNNWNVVCLQHADGSESWYGHLKNGSLTSKNLGQTVAEGEYLGVIGSSGNSTGPHLHFEVYNSASQLVDPYVGPCNTWTSSSDSWWQIQKPYWDPKINALLTHSIPPQFNTCPTTETPNIEENFGLGSNVTLAIYLADQIAGTSVNLTLRKPDNSIQSNWNLNFVDDYYASYWYWTFPASQFLQQGTYQFSATYLGNTITRSFNYGALDLDEIYINPFILAPNPAKETISIINAKNILPERIAIFDLMGKKVLDDVYVQPTLNISALSKGVYFMKISIGDTLYTSKFIKE
jgi:murein DD-endopeptidase MepM/ murein hydrolase activator NlpD